MKYDVATAPLGSAIRAKAQLANLDLLKALKTCRNGKIQLDSLQTEFTQCLERLYSRKGYGVILSAYYMAGVFGQYSVGHLLRRMYEAHDFPSLLKQAYRFDVYGELKEGIDEAIEWHTSRGLPDAEAWRRKFTKLREQELLRNEERDAQQSVKVQEEIPDESPAVPRVFELKPFATKVPRPHSLTSESVTDPYIISQTARAKMEQANAVHQRTLEMLKAHLHSRKRAVSESKLIDAYAVLGDGPAIHPRINKRT
jgi:hypothetical protein